MDRKALNPAAQGSESCRMQTRPTRAREGEDGEVWRVASRRE